MKFLIPGVLMGLSFIPSVVIRTLIFEVLAIPFGGLLKSFRCVDTPLLTTTGAIIVASIWSLLIFSILCCLDLWKRKKK